MQLPETLVEGLAERAARHPERVAFRFLADGEVEAATLTYGELDARARGIAERLSAVAEPGARALLLYPPGLDFVTAFLGCLHAGVVAVPAYPPRNRRRWGPLAGIAADAEPSLVLCEGRLGRHLQPSDASSSGLPAALSACPWLATGEIEAPSEAASLPRIGGGDLAFLQYTSGSTSAPKGVRVTHGALVHNQEMIHRAFAMSEDSVVVSWLPLYHDMGLIGTVLQPLYAGATCVLMPPVSFLQRPRRWLEAIHRYRGTTSGGPNFAYDLCVDKIPESERAGLDLSCWRVAFNGAEPVRAETLERFAEAFGPGGFEPRAFYPCYGLAEATLFVAGGKTDEAPVVGRYRSTDLAKGGALGSAVEHGADEAATRLVGCGEAWLEQELRIVDPESRRPVAPGSVGEIWVGGASVADGYWRQPELSREVFGARLAQSEDDAAYLRTGDLGFLDPRGRAGAGLFVTGRLKDLIILRGRNLYPQDLERTAEAAHPDLRPGGAAAFSVEVATAAGREERLVMILEVRRHPRASPETVIEAVRRAVSLEFEASIWEIVLISTGTLLKTSSGKVRRSACRQAYRSDLLEVVARGGLGAEVGLAGDLAQEEPVEGELAHGEVAQDQVARRARGDAAELTRETLLALPPEAQQAAVGELLRGVLARSLGPAVWSLSEQASLSDLGLDSLAAVEVQQVVEQRLGIHLGLDDLLEGVSLAWLEGALVDALESEPSEPSETSGTSGALWLVEESRDERETFPLAEGQRALWFLERLAPDAAVYNVAAAARVRGELDTAALARALETLVATHGALRTTFAAGAARNGSAGGAGEPTQRVHSHLAPELGELEAGARSAEELLALLEAEAFRPFDLERGPLVRAAWMRVGESEHLLVLAVHHLVSDFRTLALMLDQWQTLYRQALLGETPPPAVPSFGYRDFVAGQRRYLAGAAAGRDRAYWHRRLSVGSGEAPVLPAPLELPTDHPRPAVQTYGGRSVPLRWRGPWVEELRHLAREHRSTLFVTLLSLFQLWLARLSGHSEVLVGVPTLGRPVRGFADVLGYFVNPVVMRGAVGPGVSFGRFLEIQRDDVLADLEHGLYPFPRLVEELQPVRDTSRSPLFQVLFSFHQAPVAEQSGGAESPALAGFAIGEGGQRMEWSGLELESVALPSRPVPFDLSLTMAAVGEPGEGGIEGSLQLNRDLFDAATAGRLVRQLEILARAAVAEPGLLAARLPLLSPEERAQVIEEWNDTAGPVTGPILVHEQVRAQARRTPEQPALVFADRSLSYREVDERSDRLAALLRTRGVGVDDRVGVCAERSADLVVALLGILKAGAAYLPLDPEYPEDRLRYMLADSGARLLLTEQRHAPRFRRPGLEMIHLSEAWEEHPKTPADPVTLPLDGSSLAYAIYTSGSTGLPKGTLVPHAAVVNFFAAMDRHVDHDPPGTWLAVTSISFDISVLELLWTLARGFRVVVQPTAAQGLEARLATRLPERGMDFGLFFFSADSSEGDPRQRYRLLLDAARFADERGFSSVWTPERHFHAFGGLYPNPSVTGAALAAVTQRVGIRAGSVVLPLHHPVRVAEEWSVVDNLSGGRVGLSVASGWHPDDFVLRPEAFAERKAVLEENLETLRRLWRGEAVTLANGVGAPASVRILPPPLQPELPVWVTAAGSPETFRTAGRLGARVLTHLLGQSFDELVEKLELYRQAWREAGHAPLELGDGHAGDGFVTLMLHTYVGQRAEAVREIVREPFKAYLKTSFGLMRSLAPGQDLEAMTEEDMARLLDRAFDRYFETSGLFGTPAQCLDMIDRLKGAGVDEVGCLLDFGVEHDRVMAGLELLDLVRRRSRPEAAERVAATAVPASLAESLRRWRVTHLQCTPSQARALLLDPEGASALGGLRQLLVGGEALPVPLARELASALAGPAAGEGNGEDGEIAVREGALINVYGPTETTIWSSAHRLTTADLAPRRSVMAIGRPLLNTEIVLLDRYLEPVPPGLPGELYIGGLGVVRGYHRQARRTAERFVPDATGRRPGGRLYRTGDLARQRPDGVLEFLGRNDHQVKLRGHRIELGEVETRLAEHPAVGAAVAVVRQLGEGDQRLVAYVVPARPRALKPPPPERRRRLLAGREHFELPGGLPVAQVGSANTRGLVQEIFDEQIYLRHGLCFEDGACIFDVGANIGLFSLFAHLRCRAPRIFAFEPIPPTCEVLRTNVELYDLGVEVFECGLGERREEVEFTFYPRMAGLSGRFPEEDAETTRAILEAWFDERPESRPDDAGLDALVAEYLVSETFSCRVETVSEMIRRTGVERIDLLKIDVERSEVPVLRGIEDEHWPLIRQIVLEIHSRELLDEVSALLRPRGFDLEADELIPVGDRGEHVYMLYAVRPEARAEAGASSELAGAELEPGLLDVGALRSHLAQRLPEAMMPSAIVVLDALPLTPNGKIDRQALPAPEEQTGQRQREMVAPTSDLERKIAEVWREALRLPAVGIHDNFFETGGNSLLLVTAQGQLREVLGREVTLVDLMRYPTVHSLAVFLEAGDGGAETQRRVSERGKEQRKALERQRAAQKAAQLRARQRARSGPASPRGKEE